MAFISQEDKKELLPGIKKVLKTFNMKGTVSINNHSTLIVTLSQGDLDLISVENKLRILRDKQVSIFPGKNVYLIENGHFRKSYHHLDKLIEIGEHEIFNFYTALFKAMKGDKWFDKSDMMTDYCHIAYYCYIDVGRNKAKPYIYTKKALLV
tara:strand:+ start:59 stop:514 length:456 start_codon:yes stop_codon:yes gene_type:complete